MRTTSKNILAVLNLRLEQGAYVNGELPSERELAAEFGVTRPTIRRAVKTLIAEGRLDRMENGRLKYASSAVRRTLRIGYFYPSLGSWNYELQYLALREIAEEFHMKIISVYYDFWNDPSLTEGLESVDAIILHPRPNIPDWIIRKLSNCGKPVWALGYDYSMYGIPSLMLFPDRAVVDLLNMLYAEGFNDMDLLNITPLSGGICNRVAAWRSFQEKIGGSGRLWDLSRPDNHLPFCELRNILRRRLETRIIRTDRLILCSTFPAATVFLRAAADLGMMAGRDYSLACIGCESHAEMTVPTVTGVDTADIYPYFRHYLEWLDSGKPWMEPLFQEALDYKLIRGDSLIRGSDSHRDSAGSELERLLAQTKNQS